MLKSLLPILLLLTLTALFLVGGTVFAIGGGGGGTVPSCTEDTWSCTDWGPCSTQGKQVRTCTLTFDCTSSTTPEPATEQNCTPPKSPSNTNLSSTNTATNAATNTSNTNRSTNASSTNSSVNSNRSENKSRTSTNSASCAEDRWTCGEWSTDCDTQGRHTRTCSLAVDCPTAATKPPEEFKKCEKLQCGKKISLRERIACRLNLSPSGIARELELEFLPEECRTLATTEGRKECIDYYKSYQPCWQLPVGKERFSCARNILKLGPIVSDLVKECRGKTGEEQVQCKQELKDKVFDFIKFRFYDLEQRAEALGERGADLELVADLVATIEQKKQEFNAATTKQERRQIILDVRQAWNDFIKNVKNQIRPQ